MLKWLGKLIAMAGRSPSSTPKEPQVARKDTGSSGINQTLLNTLRPHLTALCGTNPEKKQQAVAVLSALAGDDLEHLCDILASGLGSPHELDGERKEPKFPYYEMLSRLGKPGARRLARHLRSYPHFDDQICAAQEALFRIGSPAVSCLIPLLIPAHTGKCSDTSPELVRPVLVHLAERAVPELIESLDARAPEQVKGSINALWHMGILARPAVPRISEILQSPKASKMSISLREFLQEVKPGTPAAVRGQEIIWSWVQGDGTQLSDRILEFTGLRAELPERMALYLEMLLEPFRTDLSLEIRGAAADLLTLFGDSGAEYLIKAVTLQQGPAMIERITKALVSMGTAAWPKVQWWHEVLSSSFSITSSRKRAAPLVETIVMEFRNKGLAASKSRQTS